jgi:hypothetical protein
MAAGGGRGRRLNNDNTRSWIKWRRLGRWWWWWRLREVCRRLKSEAFGACQPVGWLYNALVKFARGHPWGDYKEFVEFKLMGGGVSSGGGGSSLDKDFFRDLAREDFYDERSDCRKLWNDNLTLGLPGSASTLEGKAIVLAAREAESPEGQGALPEDDERG